MTPTYVSDLKLSEYLPHFNEAMVAAGITTPRRAAAWCSQIGHESSGLRYMAEIETSNPSWSWDRTRYRGRGPIQLTHSYNYRRFGQWCESRGYVEDPELFVNKPELVEQPKWGFLAAAWYWTSAGPRPGETNKFADEGNILNVSRNINGWVTTPNGMPDRIKRWNNCLNIGAALLPEGDDGMATAGDYIKGQFMGPKDAGWDQLAPQPDENGVRWSAFLRKAVTKLTLVEAIGQLVWEATLRIAPYRNGARANGKETVLGHAAAAHGGTLDILDKLSQIEARLIELENDK
ncbi:endolysin, glycosyl hydrolase domain [Gordonia Phage JonJames]|nr:endolysin, glycosyl hydrolase domain [Gordonia Phage JonJames]